MIGRAQYSCASFSVCPNNRFSVHYAIVRCYSNGHVVCSWHWGKPSCDHRAIWGNKTALSLKILKSLHGAILERNIKNNKKLHKPLKSYKSIPVHPMHRCVYVYDLICARINTIHVYKQRCLCKDKHTIHIGTDFTHLESTMIKESTHHTIFGIDIQEITKGFLYVKQRIAGIATCLWSMLMQHLVTLCCTRAVGVSS